MKMTNEQFDTCRSVAEIWLHALAVLYVAIAAAWKLPYAEEVSATLAALGVFVVLSSLKPGRIMRT